MDFLVYFVVVAGLLVIAGRIIAHGMASGRISPKRAGILWGLRFAAIAAAALLWNGGLFTPLGLFLVVSGFALSATLAVHVLPWVIDAKGGQ